MIRIERDGKLKEWHVNSESGLEQGFTLAEPPSGGKLSGLKLRLLAGKPLILWVKVFCFAARTDNSMGCQAAL